MIATSKGWLKDHSMAIVATLFAAQNWHLFGAKFDRLFEVLANMLQAVGNS